MLLIELLASMQFCKSHHGIDLMADVDLVNPTFYSKFDWTRFVANSAFQITDKFWNDSHDLDVFKNASHGN